MSASAVSRLLPRPVSAAAAVMCLGLLLTAGIFPSHTCAQQSWNPFADAPQPGQRRPARPALPPMDSPSGPFDPAAPRAPAGPDVAPGGFQPRASVESTELPPLASDGVAGGAAPPAGAAAAGPVADVSGLAMLIADIALPAKSAAMSRLLVRQIGPGAISAATPEVVGARSIVLYRAGRLAEASQVGEESAPGGSEGLAAAAMAGVRARLALAAGQRDRACAEAPMLLQARAGASPALISEGIALQGYCGAASGNTAAASLAASLGREQGVPAHIVSALEAVAAGDSYPMTGTHRVGVLEWRLAELAGKLDGSMPPVGRLELATIVAIARSDIAPLRWRLQAGEAAARVHAIDAATLAEIYRAQSLSQGEMEQAPAGRGEAGIRRAALVSGALVERAPGARARLLRAALDDARRHGLHPVMAGVLAPLVAEMRVGADTGWFAETAIELLLAAGRADEARRWAEMPGEGGGRVPAHWSALVDIADVAARRGRSAGLAAVEEMALRGRFAADALHRLATVLDALDFEVPMRLWEAASRGAQPTSGHLPLTGVLSELQETAKRRDHLRTAVLVHRTLGPDGPEGAHMIALGDALRALKRAGLEADARALAVEALLPLWPRASSS